MSEMIERVARAIQAELRRQGAIWEDGDEDLTVMMMTSGAVADLPAVVRVSIEAMREPTEEMERAGWAELHNVQSQHDSPGGCYRAMIDSALA